jgi:hypothetical protein
MTLLVGWCDYKAAKYAVEHWHYSHRMPSGKLARMGVWENDRFIGVVLFGQGANNRIGKPYKLLQYQVCELVRVALDKHETPVTKILSIALRMLRKRYKDLKLVVSYADLSEGHHGGIYQGGNWIYTGLSAEWKGSHYIVGGKKMHGRSVRAKWGSDKNIPVKWEYATGTQKHKYLMPLNKNMAQQVESLRKPYPKRVKRSSDAADFQLAEGGAEPTRTLQSSEAQHGG